MFYINYSLTNPLEGLELGAVTSKAGKRAYDYIFCLLKPYKGINHKSQPPVKKVFYDEKEWRYVPLLADFSDSYNQLYFENEFQVGLNERTLSARDLYKLPFTISDINYLIVKSNNEKKSLIKYLHNSDYATALINHDFIVFTLDEIFEDF